MSIEQTTNIRGRPWPIQVILPLQNSYDLLLLLGLAVLLPGLQLLPPLLRAPLGLALVLVAPGYALAAALFPRRDDLDGVARAAISFGLSIAVLPVLALLLSRLPWGIHPFPITISLSIWILLFSSVAMWRRRFLAWPDIVYAPPGIAPLAWWRSLSVHVRARYVIGAWVLGALLTTGAIFLSPSHSVTGPTEFYLLGREGLAENYPREVTPGEELTVTMGLVNREPAEGTYRIEVWVGDVWNVDRRTLVAEGGPFTLSPNRKTELPVSWQMPWAGVDQKVEFLLFKGNQPEVYRQLWLWVNVIERRE